MAFALTVVIEFHSPGDEAYDKLDFYRELGVPETWIVHRDTRQVDVFVSTNGNYTALAGDSNGWLVSAATGVFLRRTTTDLLAVQFGNDEATCRLLPQWP